MGRGERMHGQDRGREEEGERECMDKIKGERRKRRECMDKIEGERGRGDNG